MKTLITVLVLLFATSAMSAQVELSWDNNETATGYKIFKTETPGDYTDVPAWIGTGTNTVITDLEPDTTYYFVIRAFNICGNESANSDEISHTTAPVCGDVIQVTGGNATNIIIIK